MQFCRRLAEVSRKKRRKFLEIQIVKPMAEWLPVLGTNLRCRSGWRWQSIKYVDCENKFMAIDVEVDHNLTG